LSAIETITASDFDVILMNPVYTPSNVPTGPSPVVASFTANPTTVSAGNPVTLSWSVSNATYSIISPQVGPVRGTSVVVTPAATTTYRLSTTNQYGRTGKSVTVTVN
jgi:hypothetical protein